MKKALILSTILLLSHQNTFTAEAAQANPNDAQFKLLASFTNESSNFDLSPDGTTIATARLGALAVFNTTTRKVQKLNIPTPDGSNKGFLGVSFANSGSFVGSTYYPEVWDPKTGKCWVVYTEKELSHYARLSPNGDQLLTIGRTPLDHFISNPVILTARIWDTQTKKPLCVLSADVRLGLLGPDDNFWSDNGKLVALPLEDTIGVWESNNPKALHILSGHTKPVISVAFSLYQNQIATASFDNTVRLWCLKTGSCLNVLEGHTERCRNIFFTRVGQVITPSLDGTVRVWSSETGECLKVLEGHKGGILTSAFCPKTGILATGSQDKTVRIWDVNTEELLQIVPCSGWVDQVAFDERGETLAIGSGKLDTFMTIQVLKKTK
ncbi:MAG: WD40 repeat domain-containing protein [Candidatus Babeliales bacterium]|jgi:WD40 repeat protein